MKLNFLDLKFSVGDTSGKPDGWIAGIASTPTIDDYDDIVLADAFADSIKARSVGGFGGPNGIAMLASHRLDQPIGSWDLIEQRGGALYVEGVINLDTEKGKEFHSHALKKGACGFSIGFRTIERSYNEETEIRTIIKGDLREISLVTIPANEDCGILAIKSSGNEPVSFDTVSSLVKWACNEFGLSRRESQKIINAAKANIGLLTPKEAPAAPETKTDPSLSAGSFTAALAEIKAMHEKALVSVISAHAASINT